jgi:hypothetical protein
MDKLDILKAAKELTGATDISQLIGIAGRIEQYLASDLPTNTWKHPLLSTVQQDAADFAATLSLMHPTRGAVPFGLYDFQRDALRQLQHATGNKIAVASARQMGWTNLLASFMLHYALIHDDTTQLLLSPRVVSSIELGERIKFMVECRPDILIKTWNKSEIQFGNNSRILLRAANDGATRGLTLHQVVIMDAAYVSHKTLANLMMALTPAMATGARVIMQSTPNLVDDPFHKFCKTAHLYLNQPWHLHPERDFTWHAQQVSNLGQYRFAKEYDALFIEEAD